VHGTPAFYWELPPGEFRDALAERIDVRRLLPIVKARLDCVSLAVLDGRRKTIVRARTERGSAEAGEPARRRRKLGPVIRVIPVRGYAKAHRDLTRWLVDRFHLAPGENCTLTRALGRFGREPADSYRKPSYEIAPGMRCDEAMKRILRALLETMRLNEEGSRANLDTEFLHDFRVAGRRTRSALSQVSAVFPGRAVDRFRRGFSWLGTVTGPVRDLDVQQLRLLEYRERLPDELRGGLDLLEAWQLREHRRAHRRLVRALDSARYTGLVAAWDRFLGQPSPRHTTLANAMRPVEQVAGERILRAHRRVIKKGRAIDDDSPPKRLHRLRVECKKLRYLLEFFSDLYPRKKVLPLVGALKKFQDHLGEFNDCAVERETLGRFLEQLPDRDGAATAAARGTVASMIGMLHDRQSETRAAFRKRFTAFSSDEVVRGFERTFGGSTPCE
jgi:CHAD domain-containing protein